MSSSKDLTTVGLVEAVFTGPDDTNSAFLSLAFGMNSLSNDLTSGFAKVLDRLDAVGLKTEEMDSQFAEITKKLDALVAKLEGKSTKE
ncbi:hypothetical protein MMC18_000824 [Xylographa bjoerkii]|nr:hypothetical protein [Xylographa bjoerkii]